ITNHEYEKPIVVTGKVFPDVGTERWSHYEIEYMADKGVVTGYPDGSFKPLQNLTRSEFAALIYRFTGVEEPTIDNPFPDVTEDHWAYKEILALKEAGLVLGDGDGNYRPEDNITRAEAMTVINMLLGRKPLDSYVKSLDLNPFNDLNDKNEWYYVAVLEATITHNYYLNDTDYEYKWEDLK
ncbi:MAG: S-layer homology domain-containing protein, partial [Clostridia bacterium]|nr:S-layer homology domain-containing protein [Clostridia bacterium]